MSSSSTSSATFPSVFWPKGCIMDGLCYGWLNPSICVAGVLEVLTFTIFCNPNGHYVLGRMIARHWPLLLRVLHCGDHSNSLAGEIPRLLVDADLTVIDDHGCQCHLNCWIRKTSNIPSCSTIHTPPTHCDFSLSNLPRFWHLQRHLSLKTHFMPLQSTTSLGLIQSVSNGR